MSVRIRFGRSVGGMYSIRVCPKRRSPRDHRRYYDYFFDTGRIRNLFGNYRISGRERSYLTCKIGIVMNAAAIISFLRYLSEV